MSNLNITEIKAFVPSKDFEKSKNLLQDFCAESQAENFNMHILVEDVESWRRHIDKSGVVEKYGVEVSPIELQPWAMKDFSVADWSKYRAASLVEPLNIFKRVLSVSINLKLRLC